MALPPKPAAFPSISEELLYNIAESTAGEGTSTTNVLTELENHTEFLGQIAQSLKDNEDNTAISLLLLISQHTATIKDNTLAIKDQNKLLSVGSFVGKIPDGNFSGDFKRVRIINTLGAYELVVTASEQVPPNDPTNRGIVASQIMASFAGDVKLYEQITAANDWLLCLANVPLYYYDDGAGVYREVTSIQVETSDYTAVLERKNYRPISL
jgi:hypothetical protein